MISLNLPDIKTAASCIFSKDTFDYFLVKDIIISTSNVFHVDGKIISDYYDKDELENMRDTEYSDWNSLRPFCYQLIKGKKLPHNFKIILMLSKPNIEKFIKKYNLQCHTSDIGGLFMQFRYEHKKLTAYSGISLNYFTMDKTIETAWDETVKYLLKSAEIYTE